VFGRERPATVRAPPGSIYELRSGETRLLVPAFFDPFGYKAPVLEAAAGRGSPA
jgi:hypothetical protein